MLKVLWYGFGGNSWQADQYRDLISELGMKLTTVHEHPNTDIPYNKDTIFQIIDSSDIVLLPSRAIQDTKSINRLALAWSRGKPCIAGALPAYKKYPGALIFETRDELTRHLIALRDNSGLREILGKEGLEQARDKLHPKDLVHHLFRAIEGDTNAKIEVIIPHYQTRADYLTLAVRSALASDGPARRVTVVSSSTQSPEAVLKQDTIVKVAIDSGQVVVHHQTERLSFSQANNKALQKLPADTTHILLLNDDAILSKEALARYMQAIAGKDIILNPYSNCDQGWLHQDPLLLGNKDLHPAMQIEEFSADQLAELANYKVPQSLELHASPFCAMYATFFSKKIYDAVGLLNTEYKNGGEDADYCRRAERLGFKSYWTRNAFVFHFGGKTRKYSEDQDYTAHHEEDHFNNALLRKRWFGKKRVAIWTGPAWEKWDIDTPYTTGIGGSEICAAQLARMFAESGHNVTMWGAHDIKNMENIQLMPWEMLRPEEEYYDLFVTSRNLNPVTPALKAKTVLAWIHDIFCLSNIAPNNHISEYQQKRVSAFVSLSPWHKNFLHDYHGLPLEKIAIIPNGVDTLYYRGDFEKEYGLLHYSSSPDRGLDNLLYCLPWIAEKVPEIKLHVYYGFFNWISAAKNRNNPQELEKLKALEAEIQRCGDLVTFKDRVNQKDLAAAWKKAYAWCYPTAFTETSCLSAREAQLSSTPIICSNVAALQTTVGESGYLVTQNPYSREARMEFVDEIVKLHKDPEYWLQRSKQSRAGFGQHSWPEVYRDYWEKWL